MIPSPTPHEPGAPYMIVRTCTGIHAVSAEELGKDDVPIFAPTASKSAAEELAAILRDVEKIESLDNMLEEIRQAQKEEDEYNRWDRETKLDDQPPDPEQLPEESVIKLIQDTDNEIHQAEKELAECERLAKELTK